MMMTGESTTATQRSKRMPTSANVRPWPLAFVSCTSVAIVKVASEQSHESGLLFKLDTDRGGALLRHKQEFWRTKPFIFYPASFILRLLSCLKDNGQNQDRLQHEGEFVNGLDSVPHYAFIDGL